MVACGTMSPRKSRVQKKEKKWRQGSQRRGRRERDAAVGVWRYENFIIPQNYNKQQGVMNIKQIQLCKSYIATSDNILT
jgi:hypothetical protein